VSSADLAGLIERLGKYKPFRQFGFNWIIPLVENVYIVNITEAIGQR